MLSKSCLFVKVSQVFFQHCIRPVRELEWLPLQFLNESINRVAIASVGLPEYEDASERRSDRRLNHY